MYFSLSCLSNIDHKKYVPSEKLE
uniref:Uncharacterized protein n=1 Tax=Arundo donax TaxID=35708 RepID=A0A0A9BQT4_ARUDO